MWNRTLMILMMILALIAGLASATPVWLDPGLAYRTNITLVNITSNQTNLTINTSALYTGGKLQSDCDDLRFAWYNITSTTYTNLSHWNENCSTGGANTTIWVNLTANIAALQNITIEMYYGNSTLTNISDPSKVFFYQYNNLVASLPFDESSGTVAYDKSGYGMNATLAAAGTAWGVGKYNSSMNTTLSTASAGANISITNSILNITTNISIEAWVYFVAPSTADSYYLIISKGYTKEYDIEYVPGATLGHRYRIWRGNSYKDCGSTLLPLNTWIHWVTTSDATNQIFYINGSSFCNIVGGLTGIAGTFNTVIGNRAETMVEGSSTRYDDFHIWNMTLNSTQISNLWTYRTYATPNWKGEGLGINYQSKPFNITLGAEESYAVADTTPPIIGNITVNSTSGYSNWTSFRFNSSIWDATGVSQVKMSIQMPNGTSNISYTGSYSNQYWIDCNATSDSCRTNATGQYNLTGVWALDTLGNQNATNVNNVNFTLTADTTPPSGGSITYANGYQYSTSIPITYNYGSDSETGMNLSNGTLRYRNGTLAGGICSWEGWYYEATEFDGSYTYTAPWDGCYQFLYNIKDNIGNQVNYTSANVIGVDTTAPSITKIEVNATAGCENWTFRINASTKDNGHMDTAKFYIETPYGNVNLTATISGNESYLLITGNQTGKWNITSGWINDSAGNNATNTSTAYFEIISCPSGGGGTCPVTSNDNEDIILGLMGSAFVLAILSELFKEDKGYIYRFIFITGSLLMLLISVQAMNIYSKTENSTINATLGNVIDRSSLQLVDYAILLFVSLTLLFYLIKLIQWFASEISKGRRSKPLKPGVG